jgi:hypothetical protein
MPNVLPPLKGWRFVIYPNDHRPPHVHVVGVEEHARFELLCDLQRVQVMSNVGFTQRQLQSVARYLLKHIAQVCNQWGKLHGHRTTAD